MKKANIAKLVLLTLIVGVSAWWSQVETGELQSGALETPVGEGVAVSSGSEIAAVTSGISYSVPVTSDFEEITTEWSETYPQGRAVETRFKDIGAGTYRRQHLIETGVERIPWVVWEDKLGRGEDGELEYFGSVAHMGNLFLVRADPETVPPSGLAEFVAEFDLFEESRSFAGDYLCLGFDDPQLGRIEKLIAAFQSRFPSSLAEFDTLSFPSVTPSDWDASRMWGLDTIYARDAWDFEKGDSAEEVVIAVIDTGMQRSHPDLADNLFVNRNQILDGDVSGWDFVDNDPNPQDEDGHGTHVAGIAGAVGNNGTGAVGVSWGVKILPLKVGNRDGLRTFAINEALRYVRSLQGSGINIVATNNSYGSGAASQSTREEIAVHQNQGILFVAASGNDGKNVDFSQNSLEYPASYSLDNIISVANSNQEDSLNGSSNFGSTSVDISAPGSEIYSTYPTDSYNFLSGTSMASPMVAGAIGLLAQAEPDLSATQLKDRIMETGDLVPSQSSLTVTGRRLNLLTALRPELKEHTLEVINVRDALVLVDSLGTEVVFETAAQPEAALTAEVTSGVNVGDIVDSGNGVFRFVTKGEGLAVIRFTARLAGVLRTVEKTVIVGDSADVRNGLRHQFSFEGTNASEPDLAGSSNGTITGASRVTSEYGGSLNLDDAAENMTFTGQFTDRVTIAALVRPDNMSVSPHPRILNMPFYYLYFSSGDGPEFPDGNRQTLKFYSDYSEFGVWNTPPRSVRDDQWYYVVGTYDSNSRLNTPELYINGELQVVRMQQEPLGSMNRASGLSYLGNSDNGQRAFDGLIADVRVYDRELSSTEISQLGATLIGDRWDLASIVYPEKVVQGGEMLFEFKDGDRGTESLQVGWYPGAGASAQVTNANGTRAAINFEAAGSYRLTVQASDGVATRVFEETIEVLDGIVIEGHYRATTNGGGIAWMEVDESLRNGFLTISDPSTGFYRIREPVTIESDGSFRTSETGGGRVVGQAFTSFTGNASLFGIEFFGEFQSVPSAVTEFEGDYEGGALGIPGDAIEMRVLGDGRVFLWRSGPFADLALGNIDPEGRVQTSSSAGSLVDLTIDSATESATGLWGSDQQVFLKEEGVKSDARFIGGFVGGFPNGSGVFGLYSEFLQNQEDEAESLRTGGFAWQPADESPARAFFAFDAAGKSLRLELVEGDRLEDVLSAAVESGSLNLDLNEFFGIRLQAPLAENRAGVVGFSIEGSEPLEVLARGLGPSFVKDGAEDPRLSIYRLTEGRAVALAPNDDWYESALFTAPDESPQGAFLKLVEGFGDLDLSAFDVESKDAAQRVWLEPGSYLLVVELATGDSGSGLIEVFGL